MHGPDGADYQLTKRFLEVVPPERIAVQHIQTRHNFTLTMMFDELGERTRLTWRVQVRV